MEKPALNILVVEDDKVDFTIVSRLLDNIQEWYPVVDWAQTYEEGLDLIKQDVHDMYLVDYLLGAQTGLDLITHARERGIEKPIIVLTGVHDEKVEQRMTAVGASDYIEKSELTANNLERSIRYALRDIATKSRLKSHENELLQIKEKLEQLTEIRAKNEPPPLTQLVHTNRIPANTRVDNYRIQHLIGRGGMGTVYVGEHIRLKRRVALKFLVHDVDGFEEVSKRFEREALAVSAVNHPNIITIYDVDVWEETPYIAMEYVEGASLKALFADNKPLPLDIVVNLQYQLARGLLQTHKASIVHRDIKPTNIIINRDGYLKVLDFGLAKLMEASRITRSEHTLGTAHYVAPEMFLGNAVDLRADIWSAGVLMYQMLTGEKPFGKSNLHRVMYAVINKDPDPLNTHDTSIPEVFQQIIDRCLSKDPAQRYTSFQIMIDDLVAIARTLDRGTDILWESHVVDYLNNLDRDLAA